MQAPKKISINTSKSRGQIKLLKYLCKKNGWKEVFTEGSLLWSGLSIPVQQISYAVQLRVNRLPQMTQLCHKKTSGYIFNKFHEYWPQKYFFVTPTYLLPQDQQKFQKQFKQKKDFYIAKPHSGCQGDGIVILKKLSQLPKYSNKQYIVQPYINNPLLLNKKKFDLRMYVLIAKIDPYIVLVNQHGLVRICTQDYQPANKGNIKNPYIHLTNYSLNKDSKNYVNPDSLQGDGNKRSMHVIWKQLLELGIDIDALQRNIQNVITGYMSALYPFIKYYYKSAFPKKKGKCFHLIGIDILIDQKFHPYVLQLNANPSLKIEHQVYNSNGITDTQQSPVDLFVKENVVEDCIKFVTMSKQKKQGFKTGDIFGTYKCIISGQDQDINLFTRLVAIFHTLTGSRIKHVLTSSQFCKLGKMEGLTNEHMNSNDYHLLFIKIMRNKENSNMMTYESFIQACQALGKKLYHGENVHYNLQLLVGQLQNNLF